MALGAQRGARMATIDPHADHQGVAALTPEVRRDLARIAHPNLPWLEPRTAPDGKPALDVLIVGAGQSGLAIGFGLMRAHVDNILVIDKAEYGHEGPWLSYARMHTLRSPKAIRVPTSMCRASPTKRGTRRALAPRAGMR
jgi:hypothetical protein